MSDREKKYEKMEEIYKQIIAFNNLNGFTNMEIATVLTTVMMTILQSKENKQGLKKVGIDIDNINIESICQIQSMWAKQYQIQNSDIVAKEGYRNVLNYKNKGDK